MISVRLYPPLDTRAKSKQEKLLKPFKDGITALDILKEEGFGDDYIRHIAAIANGKQVELATPLKDGDSVDLMFPMVGGS